MVVSGSGEQFGGDDQHSLAGICGMSCSTHFSRARDAVAQPVIAHSGAGFVRRRYAQLAGSPNEHARAALHSRIFSPAGCISLGHFSRRDFSAHGLRACLILLPVCARYSSMNAQATTSRSTAADGEERAAERGMRRAWAVLSLAGKRGTHPAQCIPTRVLRH